MCESPMFVSRVPLTVVKMKNVAKISQQIMDELRQGVDRDERAFIRSLNKQNYSLRKVPAGPNQFFEAAFYIVLHGETKESAKMMFRAARECILENIDRQMKSKYKEPFADIVKDFYPSVDAYRQSILDMSQALNCLDILIFAFCYGWNVWLWVGEKPYLFTYRPDQLPQPGSPVKNIHFLVNLVDGALSFTLICPDSVRGEQSDPVLSQDSVD
eukprot:TRINITY_DN28269_c0_g1_i1.p1 TRINITY_DN28269_c0_g1~~TRINITY_DN28269_c0_g1_i1.p1  ORF type:complete len:231 (-),score=29.89 TRINITY_DN28269_c0_g1_i1:96-737(-)